MLSLFYNPPWYVQFHIPPADGDNHMPIRFDVSGFFVTGTRTETRRFEFVGPAPLIAVCLNL